jgi:small subunit ribosomal protein S7
MKKTIFYEKILHFLIKKGKKLKAIKILKRLFSLLRKRYGNSISILFIKIITPLTVGFEARTVRIWGKTHLVPFMTKPSRKTFLAVKWYVNSAKKDTRKTNMADKLFSESVNILQKLNSKSKALMLKKLNNLQATANASNGHFRW